MSGTINLTGPATTPGATALTAPAVNTAVNAALATKAPLASPAFTGVPTIGTGGATLGGPLLQATGTAALTAQLEVQNLSAGTSASSDLVATANDGTDTTYYIDVGINSSTYNDAAYTSTGVHDGYVYTSSSNLVVGASGVGQIIRFNTGGSLLANVRATITDTGINAAAIGATTPSTGAFTTLSATGAVSGAGVVALLAAPGAIGSTTPGTGAFTTLSATGLISPAQTVGILGTTTNNSVQAGSVGEFITATVASGSAVALTTATPANVTSISLTAGDWDVRGTIAYTPAGTTSITVMQGGINTTTATLPAATTGALYAHYQAALVPGAVNPSFDTGTVRLSLSGTTTVYLVAQGTFTVSTMGAFGFIGARRVR